MGGQGFGRDSKWGVELVELGAGWHIGSGAQGTCQTAVLSPYHLWSR